MLKSIHSRMHAILRKHLREVRKTRRLTQTDLSRQLRKPQSFVAKYETGERRLDLIELLQILRALDAEIEPLLLKLKRTKMG